MSMLATEPMGATRVEARPHGGTRIDRDHELIEALRVGSPTAAERLLTTYGDRAYRLALHITGTGADAEEVVQDALWTVVRKIDSFRGDSAFGSWFYRIVTNAACQKLRGRRGARTVALDDVAELLTDDGESGMDWSARIEDAALQSELRRVLTSAIDELPADYRAVVVLRDVEGLSNHEVSAALGITVANVKTRIHRARLFLRKRLASYMGDEPDAACLLECVCTKSGLVTTSRLHASQEWREVTTS
jgi:RNA polymerase sigma-70 factor (ECF subfamily)